MLAAAAPLVEELSTRIADPRVLAAIGEVPRDRFVPAALERAAWEDHALPIGKGQTISQPTVVARMCELLELTGDETVLDIGTGSGYHAAVLARLATHVYSIERHASLSRTAARSLSAAGVENVTLLVGDGSGGHADAAPYDAINVAAASSAGVPPALCEQLGDGGRLVLPVDGARQTLVRVRRRGARLEAEDLDHVRFVPLVTGGHGAGSAIEMAE